MRDTALDYLVECAAAHRMTTYGEFWSELGSRLDFDPGTPFRQLPTLLGQVVDLGYEITTFILTALVVTEGDDPHPESGFFRKAAEVGIFPEEDAPAEGEPWDSMTSVQREFWQSQVDALFAQFTAD